MNLNKHYPRIQRELYHTAWLILPSVHQSLTEQFEAHKSSLGGASMRLFTDEARKAIKTKHDYSAGPLGPDDEEESVSPSIVNKTNTTIAVITVEGVIGKRLGMLDTMCGGCDINKVSAAIDEVMADEAITDVVFEFNTPGGSVTGVPELAAKISEVSKVKNTVAYVDMLCASAGYYLASQCNSIVSAPSATLGSVGVYSIYTDETRAIEDAGIKVNAISAGAHKLDGASFKVMTDEVRARFQTEVDKIYTDFKSAVTSKREIADTDLQGQCFSGEDLITKGLVDTFCNSIDELLPLLAKG